MVRIRGIRTIIYLIQDLIIIPIPTTYITFSISIRIFLIRIGFVGAVIPTIGDTIPIYILITHIPYTISISIFLVSIGSIGAIIICIEYPISVQIIITYIPYTISIGILLVSIGCFYTIILAIQDSITIHISIFTYCDWREVHRQENILLSPNHKPSLSSGQRSRNCKGIATIIRNVSSQYDRKSCSFIQREIDTDLLGIDTSFVCISHIPSDGMRLIDKPICSILIRGNLKRSCIGGYIDLHQGITGIPCYPIMLPIITCSYLLIHYYKSPCKFSLHIGDCLPSTSSGRISFGQSSL